MKTLVTLSLALLFSTTLMPTAGADDLEGYTLRDHIGKAWEHELVTYKLTANQASTAAGHRLVDGEGNAVPHQFDEASGTLAFQATVLANGSSTYHFIDGKAANDTDLKVVQTGDSIEISNGFTGVRIAKSISGETADTPLQSWRLASGKWVGSTSFTQPQNVKSYTAKIVEQGPVRVRVVSEMTFDNGDTWAMTFELRANEPAVLIEEEFACKTDRSFTFNFIEGFDAAYVTSRGASRSAAKEKQYQYGEHIRQTLAGTTGKLVLLQPWVRWGGYPLVGSHFNLVDAEWNDLFYMATCNEEKWVDPEIDRSKRARTSEYVMRSAEGAVTLSYTLAHGQRSYLIGSQPGTDERKIVEDKQIVPGACQRMQMRHSDYPLDRVKDYVLAWDSPPLGGSGFMSESDVKQLLEGYVVDEKQLQHHRKTPPSPFALEKALPLYFATHDPELERCLIDSALTQTQEYVDRFLKLEGQITVPFAPHGVSRLNTTCNLISAIYDSPQMTDAERSTLNAQVAFLAYLMNRDSYCSTARSFTGFPNMTACAYGNRAATASVLPGHPMRDAWMKTAVGDLRREFLDHWVDDEGNYNGTRIESLTYSRLTFDLVLGALYRVYRSGADPEAIYHPAIKQFGQWHANTSTPRDERLLGWRHDPPVGNNYYFDLSPSVYAMLAYMWQDRDPEFAGHMKWMQMQQGNKQVQAIGGFTPTFAGYRELFMANHVESVTPNYKSRVWNETSVILRSHYNDDLENMLYVIAGKGHSHYDQDSGSVTLFGKGQIIADDFGYYGYAPPTDHNMLDTPMARGGNLMHIDAFAADDAVDFVRGKKDVWTRRIQHVKHETPEGPNYFVIHDGLGTIGPATWRMWLTATDVELHDNMAIARGLFGVDSELHFASLPQGAALATDQITRSGYGLDNEGKYNRHDNTQTGVIIDSDRFRGLLTLVFPRLKDQSPPQVTSIADGNGFKIVTPHATDYVFLANQTIDYTDGELSFQGTAGFARIAGDGKATLRLNEGGDLSYGKQKIHSDAASPVGGKGSNLYPDGELLTGEYSILPEQAEDRPFTVSLEEGSPLGSDDDTLKGDYCQKVVFRESEKRIAMLLTTRTAYVDPQQIYRVSISVHLPTNNRLYLSSYASDKNRKQVKKADDKVWSWSVKAQGPTKGFKTFTTTLGPAGSGAEHIIEPSTVSLGTLLFRLYDEEGDTFYVDDLIIEPVDAVQ